MRPVMKAPAKTFRILLGGLLAVACLATPSLAQAPLRDDAGASQPPPQEIDPKILIKAKAAYSLLQLQKPPLLIDVRSRQEYNAEHIEGAISYPFTTIKMTSEYPFAKERNLMLYCGCPHHLSGMSAEILKTKGYKDIHVIDEGYWGWKALGLPIVKNPNAPKQVSMSVTGQVLQGERAVAYKDIFLLHPESGQLEATRTDGQGRFTMHLHFGGVGPEDQVLFQIDDLTLKQLAMAELTGELSLQMPELLASR
ncbi:MAG TPA: rhodanese-like domain-containing protein [Candidatus Obscuribacterales bacterium]